MLKLTGKFRQKVSVETVQLYSLKHGLYRSAFILASRARNLRGPAKYGKQRTLGVSEKQKMYGQIDYFRVVLDFSGGGGGGVGARHH